MNKPIVVPYDGSDFSKRAFPLAVDMARRARAPLHIVRAHVWSVPSLEPQIAPPYEPDFLTELVEYERADLEQVAAGLAGSGVAITTELLEFGLIVPQLRDYIETHKAGWVIMTTHGRGGFNRVWLGSVTTGLVRESSAPVLVIRIQEEEAAPAALALNHIMVALDGSEVAEAILTPALELARIFGARVTLTQTVPAVRVTEGFHPFAAVTGMPEWTETAQQDATKYLETVAARFSEQGAAIGIHVRTDWQHTAAAILDAAAELHADLIALSTHGRGFWSRAVIGSVADKVLRSSALPLLVWHAPAKEG